MSKRRKRVSQKIVRQRRIREHSGDVAVDLTTPDPDVYMGVDTVAGDEGEELHLEIRFNPPLHRTQATGSYLNLMHVPTKRPIGQIVVLPHTDTKTLRRFEEEQHVYLAFPSHAARFDWNDGMLVTHVYIKIVNVQMDGARRTPTYRVDFHYDQCDQIHPLEYYPPIRLEKQAIDARTYPQRLALSFKPKTSITSSRVPKVLGYYPGPDNLNNWKRAAMRFGRAFEILALLTYLDRNPNIQFYETGYHETGKCAAQPDGLLCDPNAIPVQHGFETYEPTRGIIEIKCSSVNCNFEGPHMAQAMWEMMAVDVTWCDLVRYCQKQICDPITKKWHMQRSIRVIRMYRNALKDAMLQTAVSKGDSPEMRKMLDEMATEANQRELEVEVDDSVASKLDAARTTYFEQHAAEVESVDPVLDRIEKRQALIFDHFQTDRKGLPLQAEVLGQIQDLCDLIKQ